MSFCLEDLNEELFDQVVFFEYTRSSGLGGWGCVIMITDAGQEYMIGMEGFEYKEDELDQVFPILAKGLKMLGRYKYYFGKPVEGWHHVSEECGTNLMIRDDFYARFMQDYEKLKAEKRFAFGLEAARDILNPGQRLPREIYAKTEEVWRKEEEERQERERYRASVRLVEGEDIEWEKLYINNIKDELMFEGYYLLLFKRGDNGSITGSKWSIVFQKEEISPCQIAGLGKIEAYNLFYKSYYDVKGPLHYPEDADGYKEYQDEDTLTDGMNSWGKFVRSYPTLEKAKEGAMYRNECCGWGNYDKTNLIRVGEPS